MSLVKFLLAATLLAATLIFLVACNGDDDASPTATITPDGSLTTVEANGATGATGPSGSTGSGESLGNGEAVAFQTAGGTRIEGVLLSEPGPARRIVVFTAPDAAAYRDMYTALVEPGLAVLAFNAPEDEAGAASAVEVAVRLVRSRDYALVYIAGAGDAAAPTVEASAGVEVDGLIVIGGEPTDAGSSDLPFLEVTSEDADEMSEMIRKFVNQ